MRIFFSTILVSIAVLISGSTSLDTANEVLIRHGQDYALFFPVSNYAHPKLTNLDQSVPNAQSIAQELENSFGFSAEIIPDASLEQVVAKLQEYQQKFADGRLPADGQLFLYFSGHGMREFNNGYFLPADADPGSLYNTGLGYDYWRQFIGKINCQHIMVAIDACYSVTFDPDHTYANYEKYGRKGELTEAERTLANHAEYPARIFFTSDSKEDKTPGRSNFARKLLQGLRELRSPDGFITSSRLFSNYVELAQPAPRAADFEGDDPSAAFLFFHQVTRDLDSERTDLADWRRAQDQDNCAGYRGYLQKHPYGDFNAAAHTKIVPCDAEDRMIAAWVDAKQANDCGVYTAFERNYPASPYVTAAATKRKALNCGVAVGSVPDNMIFIPGGTFQMGDQFGDGGSDEKPVHAVTLSDFYLSRTELTFAEYDRFCKATGKDLVEDESWGRGSRPVINVSWLDAVAYCNWWSEQSGYDPVYNISGDQVTPNWLANGYRLPTEAEWEYAARSGGKRQRFGNGQDIIRPTEVNFNASVDYKKAYSKAGTHRGQTVPVGSFSPNELGLVDMSGNVYEWCWDRYGSDYYGKSKGSNPKGPDVGSSRVRRGGSWGISPRYCRAADRYNSDPTFRYNGIGFRLARSLR